MTKVHVFGDTGGHALQLFASLAEIGVDLETCEIPEGTAIVHLGDLIHRGPSSNTIVSKVDLLMERNPGQWLQVLGNHEFQHIEDGIDFWRCNCSQDTAWTIERWYEEETARIAWALEGVLPQKWTQGNRPTGQEELISSFLATHGGLTYPIWKQIGRPLHARDAAAALQANRSWYGDSVGEAMGANVFGVVGPVWAQAAVDTHSYWEMASRDGAKLPFGQLIGHSAPYDFERKLWYGTTSRIFRENAKVDQENRRTVSFVAGSAIICMDPGYGKELNPKLNPTQPYLSFEIEGDIHV